MHVGLKAVTGWEIWRFHHPASHASTHNYDISLFFFALNCLCILFSEFIIWMWNARHFKPRFSQCSICFFVCVCVNTTRRQLKTFHANWLQHNVQCFCSGHVCSQCLWRRFLFIKIYNKCEVLYKNAQITKESHSFTSRWWIYWMRLLFIEGKKCIKLLRIARTLQIITFNAAMCCMSSHMRAVRL